MLRLWRYGVVRVTHYTSNSHAPLEPFKSDPRNVVTHHDFVDVMSKHIFQSMAVEHAPKIHHAIRMTGWIGGYDVEVWSRDRIEAALAEQRTTIKVRN